MRSRDAAAAGKQTNGKKKDIAPRRKRIRQKKDAHGSQDRTWTHRYAMHIHIHIECRYSVMSVMSVSVYGPISVYGYNIVSVVSASSLHAHAGSGFSAISLGFRV